MTVDTIGFPWDGLGHVGNPAALPAAIPQTIRDGALQTAASIGPSTHVTLSVTKAANGIAYDPPATSTLLVAKGKLTGVMYYESYSAVRISTSRSSHRRPLLRSAAISRWRRAGACRIDSDHCRYH